MNLLRKGNTVKIELETFNISLLQEDGDYIARIRFNRADDRLIVGDSNTGLLDEVIDAVQDHINKLTADLQVVRSIRSGEKS